ncbi:MAG: hypothetical protein ACLUI3_06190 [Christensenellales bacterium]
MDDMNMEITTSEHRAIVFKMNRKQAAAVALPQGAFRVAGDDLRCRCGYDGADRAGQERRREDIIVLDGKEDVFDVEEEVVEENEEVWEAIDEALHSDEE